MSEFDFYCTWEDSLTYLEMLTNLSLYRFVINRPYFEAKPIEFTRMSDQTIKLLKESPNIFLYSDEYSIFPPFLEFIKVYPANLERESYFSIDGTRSGPALNLGLGKCYEEDGETKVGRGWLSYQPYYLHPDRDEKIRPPVKLIVAFKMLRTKLRQQMEKRFRTFYLLNPTGYSTKVGALWFGKNALNLIENGEAGIHEYFNPIENLKKRKEDILD